MTQTFTKKDLQTGDIIQSRNGVYGVVILEKDCILYQDGGLNELDVFTDDLFVEGPERNWDIVKVYNDQEDPIGFNVQYGIEPVFTRKKDKINRKRAAELNDKYDKRKNRVGVIILEPCFRKCQRHWTEKDLESRNLNLDLSEAPSMTACGQLGIDRTFIPIPGEEGLFILYNKYQEEWHIECDKKEHFSRFKDTSPIVIIPEENIRIHSRSMIIRLDPNGIPENLRRDDFEKVKKHLHKMTVQ